MTAPAATGPDEARCAMRRRMQQQVMALVARATAEDWPVTADHCFLRIAYDNAVKGRWTDFCPAPAWRHLPMEQLARAADLLDEMAAAGLPRLVTLNAASLFHRRAAPGALRG